MLRENFGAYDSQDPELAFLQRLIESRDKFRVLFRRDALAHAFQDSREIFSPEGGYIEPDSWKDGAFDEAILIRSQRHVLFIAEPPPKEALFAGYPNQILEDAIAAIGILLLVQVAGRATGSHLGRKFGCAFNIIVRAVAGLAARFRQNAQDRVGLRLVVQIKANGCVVTDLHSRGVGGIEEQPSHDSALRHPMSLNLRR